MDQSHPMPDSFGALLSFYRKGRHWTQQHLAGAVGVGRNTIGRWERGDFLPESKGMVLELARHLHLDAQQTRQLLEASLTALAPHWSAPLPRNPFFTGREVILEALHTQLSDERTVTLTHASALHGLGGVGKTQIALEYAYRHALDYSAVFWIAAETEEQIVSSFARIAEVLQVPGYDDQKQQRVVAAVQRWLTTHSQWLLIWDNLEELDLLDRFLPPAHQGAILITTRRQVLGTLARGIDLLPMEPKEGLLFLLRRAKVLEPASSSEDVRQLAVQRPAQYQAAASLVTDMGGLPLALDQAGAYLEETHCSLADYLELFHLRRAVLLQQRGDGSRDHQAPVSTTLHFAITVTAERHAAVGDLLRVCALLQPDAMPEELFRQGADHLWAHLQIACHDALEWNRMVAVACASSVLSRQAEEQTLSMHRLVQAVLLDAMTEGERELWSIRVITALDAVFPEVLPATEPSAWKQCERLLPHALLCLNRVAAGESLTRASLASKAAQYLRERVQYTQAERLFQQALRIREQALGPDHPLVATSLNNLAILSYLQSKYSEAASHFQQALRIREQALGPDHPLVATSLNNLASLYGNQGRYLEAEPLLLRALQINEASLGPDHLEVARPLSNLANLYGSLGRYLEAEPLLLRAWKISEAFLGPDHPQVAFSLNYLAELYTELGNFAEAEALHQRALSIREQSLGPDHPQVASSLTDLAELYTKLGQYSQAEALHQRALTLLEKTVGPDHLDVARPLNGLANLCRERGEYGQAERLYQRALALREHHLGQRHPDTAQTLHDLATFYQKQGKLDEAISCAEQALSIRVQSLGEAHPHTIAVRSLSAHLVHEQARVESEAVSERGPEARPALRGKGRHVERALVPLHNVGNLALSSESDPLQKFLDACCERHPRAWCRSADLWQAYACWMEEHQERFPLSRGAFIAQLKAHSCRADRTKTARIWRGIALVNKDDDGR